jgi:hypothetical protein
VCNLVNSLIFEGVFIGFYPVSRDLVYWRGGQRLAGSLKGTALSGRDPTERPATRYVATG